jgi:RNA polymerase sigma factor (sigma-70 family)
MENENDTVLADPPVLQETTVYQFIAQEASSLLPTLRWYVQKFGLAQSYDQVADTAEDVLQDVIVQVLKHPEKLDKVRSPKAWMLRIATNIIKDRLDKPEYHHEHVTSEKAEESLLFDRLIETSAAMEETVESSLQFENMLALALAENRPILRMTFQEGLSGEEMAERLGLKPSTARSKLHRALNQLRQNWVALDREGD